MPNPKDELPDLAFSRRGANLSLFLDADSTGSFQVSLVLTRLGKEYDASFLPIPIPEHVILDSRWLYISNGLDEANECLRDAGISAFGKISLTQYCRLIALDDAGLMPTTVINKREIAPHVQEAIPPSSLAATLYPYQKAGFSWLSYMSHEAHGCILGDEMGLGKTLQIISLLLSRHESGHSTSLVIAPASLLENWKREIEKFAPSLSVDIHHGSDRTGRWKALITYDVVVLSYSTANHDLGMLRMNTWDVLVLDEAQSIKNPDSLTSQTVKDIPHAFGIAVSGTPFENHVLDVWSIMEFVEPAVFGERRYFSETYSDDPGGAAKLEPCLTPFLLRRTVKEVASELPPRIESSIPLPLSPDEAEAYEQIRAQCLEEVEPARATLSSLTKLRMFCTHPSLVGVYGNDPEETSVKYQYLCLLIGKVAQKNEKSLVFTSYTKMIEILRTDLSKRFALPVYVINGEVPIEKRQPIIDEFSNVSGPAVLVLNPVAAGTGLNITAATNVIHYNPEWNPAKEDQATARAYRRGQTQPVRIFKLYYVDTVEEAIFERMELKREMAKAAVVGTDGTKSDREAIIKALTSTPIQKDCHKDRENR